MNQYRYRYDDKYTSEIEALSSNEITINKDQHTLTVRSELTRDELEQKYPFLSDKNRYYEYTLKADIDCAECANEVECGLKNNSNFLSASFNFPKGELKVTTLLKEKEVKHLAKEIESDISFEDKVTRHVFNVKIDCANCAKKVESELNNNPQIDKATFNFPKGELIVESSLDSATIKKLATEAEDDIIFLDKLNSYTFRIDIYCAECALKVEKALNENQNIEKATVNYPKGRLDVKTTLSEKEVKDLCLLVEEDMKFLDDKQKKQIDVNLYRIIGSIILFLIGEIFKLPIFAICAYILSGYDILIKAVKNIFKGKVFDENFLMAIATIGALVIASYDEAAGVMIFYQIGEYFQARAVGKSRKNIESLMSLTEDQCDMLVDGRFVPTRCEDIAAGSTILVKAGEKVSIDGVVIEGTSLIDTKAITGEPVPVKVTEGSAVLSGSINGNGTLKIKTTKDYSDSTASKILRLVEESESKKAKSEKFITRFSRYYTPVVTISALLLAIVPALLGWMNFSDSLYRACILLVISCPCALVLSVPLTYFASFGSFAKNAILVKGDASIQMLSKMNALAFDKTGTLTEGVFEVQKIYAYKSDEENVLKLAATLEALSSHPIANAISSYYKGDLYKAEGIKEIPGIGIEGTIDGKTVKIGNKKISSNVPDINDDGTIVYVSYDSELYGAIVIDDKIKPTTKSAIEKLRRLGVKKLIMLSGDRDEKAQKISSELKLDEAYGDLLPSDKLDKLESLMKDDITLGYAGDGINDAPSLKRVDVGIAMGGVGSDAAIESSDIVIMNDDITQIATAISIAKKTENIVKENIYFSLAVKFIVFVLAIFGLTNMWLGVLADTGVTFLAVLNSIRALKWKEK